MLDRMPLMKLIKMSLRGLVTVVAGMAVSFALQVWTISANSGAFDKQMHGIWMRVAFVLCVMFAPLVLGALLMFLAGRRIRRGLSAGAWTQDEIGAAYSWMKSPVVELFVRRSSMCMILLMVGWVAYCVWVVFSRNGHSPGTGFAVLMFLPLSETRKLRDLLESHLPKPEPVPWSITMKPIQSQHWGQQG